MKYKLPVIKISHGIVACSSGSIVDNMANAAWCQMVIRLSVLITS